MTLTACSGDDAPAVEVRSVGLGVVTEVVDAPGTVTAKAQASVTAPADARVEDLRVADGDAVKEGDLLMRLASPAAQQRLEQALTADAGAATGEVSLPGTDLSAVQEESAQSAAAAFAASRAAARGLPNEKARAAALAQVEAAEQRYAVAQAQADLALEQLDAGVGALSQALSALSAAQRVQTRAAVQSAERTIADLTVLAPVSGVVSLGGGPAAGGGAEDLLGQLPPEVADQAAGVLGGGSTGGTTTSTTVSEGAPVDSGATLATVTDVSQLSLTVDVDETDVFLVREGQPAVVELDAVPDASYTAKVSSVDLNPTETAGGGVSYRVRLALSRGTAADGSPAPKPRPGMSAVAELQVRVAADAVQVPTSAVVRSDDGRDAVWVDAAGVAQRRRIEVGARGAEMVQVTEGLAVGERVVVAGADTVREGAELPG